MYKFIIFAYSDEQTVKKFELYATDSPNAIHSAKRRFPGYDWYEVVLQREP